MKQKKLIAGILLFMMLCWSAPALAVVEAPDAIYVGDYANVLSEDTERYIIEQNQILAQATGAQIVVVTVDFLDGMDIENYAYTIFNDWGIGDAEKNNGLLLLLAIGEENYWAMQGKGLEGVLSSGMLGDYLYEYLEPDFAVGDYDAGVYKVFNAFLEWFRSYYDLSADAVPNGNGAGERQEGTVSNQEQQEDDDDVLAGLLMLAVLLMIVIVLISMHKRRKDQNRKKNDKHDGSNGSGGTGRDVRRDDADPYYEGRQPDLWGPTSRRRRGRDVIIVPPVSHGHREPGRTDRSDEVLQDLFGGGSSRGGGAGRRSGGFGGFGGFGGPPGGFGGGFGGGGSRGGGAGRR